ncbi:MAG: 4Fe-4S dicluster domain-containing protein [Desulfofustis sp.]|jgi:heterodisulfide reductase subunit C/nitrate reductase gamma subunit|nr:4Fe-4S dicluster domain-containing protein [Desulfofustis sp.]
MNVLVGLSLLVFLAGISYRIYGWVTQTILSPDKAAAPDRVSSALKALFTTLLSAKLVTLITAFFTDVLFQKRLLAKSTLRWITHCLIFFGFIPLLLMHGLGTSFSESMFNDYQSTLQPYLTLRNLFGLMVLAGVCIGLYRRLTDKPQRVKSMASDWVSLALVGAIVVTGMLLESSKISSYSAFQTMAEDYGGITDAEELLPLETYWAAEHGLKSPNVTKPFDPALVEEGREISADTCMECHAPAAGAFVSFPLAKVVGPITASLGDATMVNLLFWLHILCCVGLLAWLPFSKMFHVISAPVSLLINGVMGFKEPGTNPANLVNRRMIGLSACTHCGACSELCSSLTFYESFQNDFILPSEKVQILKKVAAGKAVDQTTLDNLQKGLYICTSCDRCSKVCPSGINLRELFTSSRYQLLNRGVPETSMLSHFSFPLSLARTFVEDHKKALRKLETIFKDSFTKLKDLTTITIADPARVGTDSYQSCYSCQRCTNICPVVRLYDDPVEKLDMLPHQIIFSLGIGNKDIAVGSKMIWSCSTCYLCQEHCPNQVELTDIFYNLKNEALRRIEGGRA